MGIKAIVLKRNAWAVGRNCDEIKFGFGNKKIWYQPIRSGVSLGCFWAEDVDRVYYSDKTIEDFVGVRG